MKYYASKTQAEDAIKERFIRLMFGVIEDGELDSDNIARINLFVNVMTSDLKTQLGLNNINPEIVVSQIEIFLENIIKVE